MTAEPLLALAVETTEPQGNYHRYWWLVTVAASLAGWLVVLAALSFLATLLH